MTSRRGRGAEPGDATKSGRDGSGASNTDRRGAAKGASTKDRPTAPLARGRARWVAGIVGVAFALCAIQLFAIQVVQGPTLAEQGRKVRTSASAISAPRGQVLDSDGQVMVDSVETFHIAVNQVNIREYRQRDDDEKVIGRGPAAAAAQLAPLLDKDPAELGGMLVGDSTYRYLAKNVDADTYRAIRELGIYGIEWEPNYERVYPGGNAAASVLGSVDVDGNGDSGLESTYNDLLTGTPGEAAYEIGPTGEIIPGGKVTSREAVPGATINTSIHADLQKVVQDDLDHMVQQHDADWGTVVVIEVATGRVLVLADSGLKSPEEGPQTSAAVQWVFEPGSVGKLLTLATALEEGTITPTTSYVVDDRITAPDGEVIKDSHNHPTEELTVNGILARSLNTGTMEVGYTVSDEARYQTMRDMGIGELTGIELPGESPGMLRPPDQWQGRDRWVTMFGQGYAMTAVQQGMVAATIGNGGVWTAPHLVDGYTDEDGTFHPAEAKEPRQVLRPETAAQLLTMMESVAADEPGATGKNAAVVGYRTAVKTGTAEIPGGTVAQVAGVVPADAPKLAISAVIYNPKKSLYGTQSAAPLFAQVTEAAVRSLNIPASDSEPDLYPMTPTP